MGPETCKSRAGHSSGGRGKQQVGSRVMCGRSRKEAGVAGAPSVGGEWGSRGRSRVVRLPRAACACAFLQEGKTL